MSKQLTSYIRCRGILDEYDRLELAIEKVLTSQNASYAAPVSGVNQQSVQLADLDGDGMDEAIAFLKAAGDKPLRACIFSHADGDYHLTDVIEGDGTSFASVEYVQLTDRPGIELVIGWQLSPMFCNRSALIPTQTAMCPN